MLDWQKATGLALMCTKREPANRRQLSGVSVALSGTSPVRALSTLAWTHNVEFWTPCCLALKSGLLGQPGRSGLLPQSDGQLAGLVPLVGYVGYVCAACGFKSTSHKLNRWESFGSRRLTCGQGMSRDSRGSQAQAVRRGAASGQPKQTRRQRRKVYAGKKQPA